MRKMRSLKLRLDPDLVLCVEAPSFLSRFVLASDGDAVRFLVSGKVSSVFFKESAFFAATFLAFSKLYLEF